jgi:hypothetical protein
MALHTAGRNVNDCMSPHRIAYIYRMAYLDDIWPNNYGCSLGMADHTSLYNCHGYPRILSCRNSIEGRLHTVSGFSRE